MLAVVLLLLIGASCSVWVIIIFPRANWHTNLSYWRERGSITMYGKVVDQNGAPVVGATVVLGILEFDVHWFTRQPPRGVTRYLERQTDVDGAFSVVGETGNKLRVVRISHPEFATFPDDPGRSGGRDVNVGFQPTIDASGTLYVPDPEKPAILPLRRPGEARTAFPTRGGSEIRFARNADDSAPLLVRGRYYGVVCPAFVITALILVFAVPSRHLLPSQCVVAVAWLYSLARIAPQYVSPNPNAQILRWTVCAAGLLLLFCLVPAVRRRLGRRWAWYLPFTSQRGFEIAPPETRVVNTGADGGSGRRDGTGT